MDKPNLETWLHGAASSSKKFHALGSKGGTSPFSRSLGTVEADYMGAFPHNS